MAIEVRQLVVRSRVGHDHDEPSGPRVGDPLDAEQLKREILEACRRMVEEHARRERER